jgi:hypothetical protein
MTSTTYLCVLGLGLLLTTACKKEHRPAPATISQAPLEGRWQESEVSYKNFDGRGKLTDSGYTLAANPAVYSTLDATTWKQSGQLTNDYLYVRQDSTLIRSFYFNGGKTTLLIHFASYS